MVESEGVSEHRAPDGGWGWIVAGGSFLIMSLLSMLASCYSILFSDFLIERGASSSTIAWIFNTHMFLWNVFGLFTGPLTKEFGFRRICFLCAFIASFFLLILAFASNIWYLLVFFSLCGLFAGLACKPCYLQVAQYFDNRRGQANGFLMAGSCTGHFVGPPLTRYLLEQYSFPGATLIMGAILLNSCVGAALFQPVEWHMKKSCPVERPILSDSADEDTKQCRMVDEASREVDVTANETLDPKREAYEVERRLLVGNLSRRVSQASNLTLAISYLDLTGPAPNADDGFPKSKDSSESGIPDERGVLKTLGRLLRSTISDLAILKTPRGFIIASGGVCALNSYLNFLITAPFAIQHAGYSLEDAAWCMSYAAVANLVARFTASSLSDCHWFDMRIAYMSGVTVMAFSILLFSFMSDLVWMKVTLVIWGFGVGVNVSLYILIMPRFMGLEKMPSIFGAQSFATAFANLILGPLVGMIRDVSNSYAVAMWVMTAEVMVCVVLWFFMPAAVAYEERKEALKEAI